MAETEDNASLQLLAVNLTQRCNLACSHCYLDAQTLTQGDADELGTGEVKSLLDEVAVHHAGAMIVLTGGEPLFRHDLELIIRHGSKAGLAMVVGTNGMLLTERRVQSLKQAGLMGAGISVDSLDPDNHDSFRGYPGAWDKTMTGIENCRRLGLDFQIHFSITRRNAGELQEMISFSRACGARVLNIFFLICVGRGTVTDDLPAEQYESLISEILAAQRQCNDLIIRPRCAPHFKRIAHQQHPDADINRISGMEGDGCIAATHYARVNYNGDVTVCPYIDQAAGNIRTQSFTEIWREADDFVKLRNPLLGGKCGRCEYQKLCGGCRARPHAQGTGMLDSDPNCAWQPVGIDVIQPCRQQNLKWSDDALARLERIPAFVRKMVRRRAEQYVRETGATEVTTDHLSHLAARRFGGHGPARPEK